MGFILFFMIIAGAVSRFVHGACCVNVKHLTRSKIVTRATIMSFFLIAVACMNKNVSSFFWIAVAASTLNGIG